MSAPSLSPGSDAADRAIIRATQAGLPLDPRPFDVLGRELGMEPEAIIARMKAMLESGVIRRIGAVPNHYALGYTANGMSVWDVRDEDVKRLGERIGAMDCVSHCYQRPRHLPLWPYNLFAMVHGKSRAEVDEKVAAIARELAPSLRAHDVLYSTRILKKTGLRIGQG